MKFIELTNDSNIKCMINTAAICQIIPQNSGGTSILFENDVVYVRESYEAIKEALANVRT